MKKILLLMVIVLPFIFISCDKDEPVIIDETEYFGDYLDLGLPSGTLWATRNIGANCPEDYGDYFAWGETAPKELYDRNTYKWSDSDGNMMTKYCTDIRFGIIDGKTELEPEDDAASVNWGASWRMPTVEQQQELARNCRWRWAKRNGVYGIKCTGPNGNSLFFPAAGARLDNLHTERGLGKYWSRSLFDSRFAHSLFFNQSGKMYPNHSFLRELGYPVRAVRVSQD